MPRIKADHERRREQHRNKSAKAPQLSLAQARGKEIQDRLGRLHAARARVSWGCRTFDDYPLEELVPVYRLDAVLQCLGIRRQIPGHFADPVVGEAASSLYADATRMLQQLIDEKWLRARAVVGIFPGQQRAAMTTSRCTPTSARQRRRCACIICGSRSPSRRIRRSPAWRTSSRRRSSGRADYIGAFAVTAGIGIDEHVARFEAAHDDYSSIMLKALADRLAEALAERMHERVRREFWGYAPEERLDGGGLIRENIRGSGRRRVTLPVPSTRRKPRCGGCSIRSERRHSPDRILCHVSRPRR